MQIIRSLCLFVTIAIGELKEVCCVCYLYHEITFTRKSANPNFQAIPSRNRDRSYEPAYKATSAVEPHSHRDRFSRARRSVSPALATPFLWNNWCFGILSCGSMRVPLAARPPVFRSSSSGNVLRICSSRCVPTLSVYVSRLAYVVLEIQFSPFSEILFS